jgi:hypothetical protein
VFYNDAAKWIGCDACANCIHTSSQPNTVEKIFKGLNDAKKKKRNGILRLHKKVSCLKKLFFAPAPSSKASFIDFPNNFLSF